MNIVNEISERLVFFDGAMGTTLQKKGMKTGDLPEALNFSHPELIKAIHREYAAAGAEILKSNTFGASRYKLEKSGLAVKDVIFQAISLARQAAPGCLVALDIGPIGQMLAPVGPLAFDDAYAMFQEQVRAGVEAGADLVLIETVSDLYEAKAAILAVKENSQLPVFCTMTFQDDGRTLTGTDPETLVTVLEALGVDALGVNCSLGPKELYSIVAQIMRYASVPVIVQPNAGIPILEGEVTKFLVSPEEFVDEMQRLVDLGPRGLGGCCGTTPEFIQLLTARFKGRPPLPIAPKRRTTCASPAHTVEIGKDITIIGERINPTGKKPVKEALKGGDLDYLLQEAIRQKEAGAHVLDVNVGIPEIDEAEVLSRLVKEIQEIVDIPLQFDSSNTAAIERACRYYNGKPIINSVNGKAKSMAAIFPIVQKYGCLVIGLCMDERGLPQSAQERVEIAEKIIQTAAGYGIPEESILVDCLTLTASAQQAAVQDSLVALTTIRQRYNVQATLGASNVSYGLPARPLLNRTYLAMALQAGLTAPITDPLSPSIRETVSAFRVLADIDQGGEEFIRQYKDYNARSTKLPLPTRLNGEGGPVTPSRRLPSSVNPSQQPDLRAIIVQGLKNQAGPATEHLLAEMPAMEIVDTILIPALDEVGDAYEAKKIFLPQLIRSAETVKAAFGQIKRQLQAQESGAAQVDKGAIVLATVEGDVHDIGKNIVKILLENYGYRVIDLGKDVSAEQILTAIHENSATLVGLSALMTTTVLSMQNIIQKIRKASPSCQIMVGGAVLTDEFAHEIGADYYGKDAKVAVRIAQQVLD